MLHRKIIDTLTDSAGPVAIDQSRCLRMRFNKSACRACAAQCRFDAVRVDGGIDIRRDACSACMLCVSTCPSGCFDVWAMDFFGVIARVRKAGREVPVPVLGCAARTDLKAHERTACFGFLSEEHFIALSVFLDHSLQINLAGCRDCRNAFIVDALKKRIGRAGEKTGLPISEKILLVEEDASLAYQEIAYDRRGFFQAMKRIAFREAARSLDSPSPGEIPPAYSAKKIPLRRELLNRALDALSEGGRRELLKAYYNTFLIEESCDTCYACIGICPTGALQVGNQEAGAGLYFRASHCSGCGLCEAFCLNRSASVRTGFSGASPFTPAPVRSNVLAEAGGAERAV